MHDDTMRLLCDRNDFIATARHLHLLFGYHFPYSRTAIVSSVGVNSLAPLTVPDSIEVRAAELTNTTLGYIWSPDDVRKVSSSSSVAVLLEGVKSPHHRHALAMCSPICLIYTREGERPAMGHKRRLQAGENATLLRPLPGWPPTPSSSLYTPPILSLLFPPSAASQPNAAATEFTIIIVRPSIFVSPSGRDRRVSDDRALLCRGL